MRCPGAPAVSLLVVSPRRSGLPVGAAFPAASRMRDRGDLDLISLIDMTAPIGDTAVNTDPILGLTETPERGQPIESSVLFATKKFPNQLLIAYGELLFRYRNIGFPIIAIALLAAFEPGRSRTTSREVLIDLIGLALAGAGQVIHVATLGTAWIRRGGHNNKVHADQLVTSGWYKHCRNPIYIGNLLIVVGLLIMLNNFSVFVIVLAGVLISYHAIVVTEEKYLIQRFGIEYRSYCQRVPRWRPILKDLSMTARSTPIHWRWAITKAYTSAYSWVLMTVLILTYKAWVFRGLGSVPETVALAGVFLGCSLLFLLARWLKKRSSVLAADPAGVTSATIPPGRLRASPTGGAGAHRARPVWVCACSCCRRCWRWRRAEQHRWSPSPDCAGLAPSWPLQRGTGARCGCRRLCWGCCYCGAGCRRCGRSSRRAAW